MGSEPVTRCLIAGRARTRGNREDLDERDAMAVADVRLVGARCDVGARGYRALECGFVCVLLNATGLAYSSPYPMNARDKLDAE